MSYRDLPEWQEAQRVYLFDSGDPDETYERRLRAAFRMHTIESTHQRDPRQGAVAATHGPGVGKLLGNAEAAHRSHRSEA